MPSLSLSVVLPNFNHGRYLGAAVQALLAQSRRPDELIVIDDGSTDESLAVLAELSAADPLVSVYRNDRNRGTVYTMNRGLSLARGTHVYTASADDRVRPRLFAETMRQLEAHPEAGLCVTDFEFLDPESGKTHPKHLRLAQSAGFLAPADVERTLHLAGDILPAYGGIFRLDALQAIGGFREPLRWHSDWFATLVLALRHGCCYVPEALASIRMLPGSYSSGSRRWEMQSRVLGELLTLLESDAFRDVAPAVHRSGALAYFGFGAARAGWSGHRDLLGLLPWRRMLWRETKNLLLRAAPHRVREHFWRLRQRLLAPKPGSDAW